MSREEALALLDAENLAGFVGIAEDASLEFKGAPYALEERPATFELAKDVSAMANGGGGLLLIGFRTRREDISRQDIVDSVRQFRRNLFDLDRARSIIRVRVYPEVGDLELRWVGNDDRGVAVIDVPAQAEERKPFIIIEPIEEAGQTPGYLVGLATRRGAHAEPMRPHDLHRLLRDGGGLSRRLELMETSLARIEGRASTEPATVATDAVPLTERVNEALAE